MPRNIRNMALFMMVTILSVSAQSKQGIVRISPFTGSGIPASELATLERLVASHVAELKIYRVTDDAGREMALGETEIALGLGYQSSTHIPLVADIIVTGHLGRIGDLYVFTLENTQVSSGEKFAVSDTGFSVNDIVLRTRAVTINLLGKADGAAFNQTSGTAQDSMPDKDLASEDRPAELATTDSPALVASADITHIPAPTLAQIAGTWRGDRGLETVRLFPNGMGMAVLSGGGTMRLKITLDGDSVVIIQDQPNDATMYRSPNINFEIATRIASLARPMKWSFLLSANGQTLEGLKESILVSGSSAALTVDNDYVREASWSRISR